MPTDASTNKLDKRQSENPQLAGGRERRQVTALFYDIIGSTALLTRHDPEDFGAAQRRVHEEAALVFKRHGGHIDRLLGDGGCVYFGYPVPLEDAAESAVTAALELVDRCRSLPIHAPIGVPLHIRVGIATGLAVLGAEEGIYGEVVGLAPNLAARAQAEAEADTIVVTESAYRLTRSAFEYQSLGVRSLKGFEEPQHLWRPLQRRSSEDRFSLLRRSATPLTGRQEELALCWNRWERAKEGAGQVIFLAGEPGIGKSRLVTELRRRVSADHDCETRVLQCQPRGSARPLHPILDHIAQKCSGSADSHTLDGKSLRKYLATSAPGSAAASNLLQFVLGQRDEQTIDSEFAGLTGDELQRRIVAAVLDIISSWSRLGPQLIIIEDIHWADNLTRAVLKALVKEIQSLPILLAATTRDWFPGKLGGAPNVLTLSLARLDARAVRELVEAVFSPLTPPSGLDAFVQSKSEGVPLFVEELASLLKERLDPSENTPEHWRRALRKDGIITLQDLLAARLAGTGAARRVAQIASVIGREFSRRLLVRLAEGDPVAASLDEHLDQLTKAGLVWRREGQAEDCAYRFGHVLVQDAAYESLLKSERRELHDRLVRMALAADRLEISDELLSWHCAQAGRLLEAATYAIRAAEACAMRSATQDADRLLIAAEEYLAGCPASPESDELTLQLLATRGPIATALHGVGSPEARAIYDRGVMLCREKAGGEGEKWFPLYWGWWFTAPDFGTQRMRSQIIIGDLDKAGDPEVRLQAFHCAWATEFDAGNLANCLRSIERGLMLYDPNRARLSRARYGGHDARVCGLGQRALSLWCVGKDARESAQAALQWAEEIGHRGSLCHALDITATLHFYERSVDDVAAVARRIHELGELHSLPGMSAKAKIFGGWARALTTSVPDGLSQFGEGLAMLREIGTEEDFPIYFDMHAELLARADSFGPAIELLDRAIERGHRTGHVFWLSELYRRRAILRKALGAAPEACLRDLRQALAHAEQQGATTLTARARAEVEWLGAGPPAATTPAAMIVT